MAMFKSDEPRVYRDVARAIAMCRDDFGYFGPITLSTDRQPSDAGGPPSSDRQDLATA